MNQIDADTHRLFSKSDALFERASAVIPLASQTFSKSHMQFARGAAPLFLERGDGCRVWDVDGNEYLDFIMGLLPVVLGYRDPDVDNAIREQLDRGISFSLATDLETRLAERLIELIPCAEMVRYGKNGSDATSAAVRLARAYTGRDRIACCGYHGWHDWYIGTTTRDLGVPRAVGALTSSFPFNNASALEEMLASDPQGFAAIILEPMEFEVPDPEFLQRVRDAADRYKVVLIFDEIVTGFRLDLGGAQTYFGVTPDLASFGKAMGNGMPISAVVGRREIMARMEDIFFSGTFGGEALSLAASLATLDKLEKTNGIARMHAFGADWRQGMEALLDKHGLSTVFRLFGSDWWARIAAVPDADCDPQLATTLLRQELAERGILQLSSCNLSLAHTEDGILTETLSRWDQALADTAAHLKSNDPAARLRGEMIKPVFQVRR
jgi:glutamate-1-semialdehyde 2,1-aminomutase